MRFISHSFVCVLIALTANCPGQNLTREQRIKAEMRMTEMRASANKDNQKVLVIANELFAADTSNMHALAYRALANHWTKNYKASLSDFNLYMAKRPSSAFCAYRATLMAAMGDTAAALKDVSNALSVSAFNLETCSFIGSIWGVDKRLLNAFERVVEINPDNYVVAASIGIIKDKQGDLVGAAAKYTAALKALGKPLFSKRYKYRWLFWLKADMDFQFKHYQSAIDAITQCILLHPEDPTYYKERIKYYVEAGDKNKACADICQLKTIEQNYLPYQNILHCNFSDAGCSPSAQWLAAIEAEKFYIKGHVIDKTDSGAVYQALGYYAKALELKPNHLYALGERAMCHMILNQDEKVMTELNKLIRLNSRGAEAYRYRADLHKEAGHFPEALADAKMAIRLDSLNPEGWVRRASVETLMGDTAKAIAALSEALRLNKYYSYAYHERGILEMEKGNYHAGLRDFLKAIEIEEGVPFISTYPTYYYSCANAYDKLMLYDKAMEYLDKAIAIKPGNGGYYYRSGEIKARMKDMDGACRDWTTAKQLGYQNAEEVLLYNCGSGRRK